MLDWLERHFDDVIFVIGFGIFIGDPWGWGPSGVGLMGAAYFARRREAKRWKKIADELEYMLGNTIVSRQSAADPNAVIQ